MAESTVPALVGAAATVGSKWMGSTSFTSRHEAGYRSEAAEVDKHINDWYSIPPDEVPSDEEEEFSSLRDKWDHVLLSSPRLAR